MHRPPRRGAPLVSVVGYPLRNLYVPKSPYSVSSLSSMTIYLMRRSVMRGWASWKELRIHESIFIDCGSPKENDTFLALLTEN